MFCKKGKEMETPHSATLAWVSKGLRKYLDQDEYGVYKKEDAIIPWFYRLEYNKFKKLREDRIESAFQFANFTYPDKMNKEELLRMG